MSGVHAFLPSSGAPYWVHCSAWPIINANAPDSDTEESKAGTAAHWVGSECLNWWRSNDGGVGSFCSDWIGRTEPDGVVIDEVMTEGAQTLVDDVLSVCREHGGLRNLLVEQPVSMPQIHEQNAGTLDVCLPLPEKNLIYLWDYKHGHRETRARDNFQLIDYIAGVCNRLQINGDADQNINLSLRIVQPYSYKSEGAVDVWEVNLADLRGYFNQLEEAASEVFKNPTLTAGVWCRDCPAIGHCPAARKAGYSVIDYAKQPYALDTLDAASLAAERQVLTTGREIVKARLEAVEDQLKHLILRGEGEGSGLTAKTTLGRSKWTVPPAQAIALASQFGVNARKEEVLTPTQTKDAVAAKLRPGFIEVMKKFTHRPSGSLKLVDAEDGFTARAFKRK